MEATNELLEFIKSHLRVYIYGAGAVAEKVVECLKLNEIDNIEGVIVSEGHKKDSDFMNYKVLELPNVQFSQGDGIVLSVLAHKQRELIINLDATGISNNIDIYGQRIIKDFNNVNWYIACNDKSQYFNEFAELNDLGIKYGTDKAEGMNNYLKKYEFFCKSISMIICY